MKWTNDHGVELELRTRMCNGLSNHPSMASDIIAALRANPEAMAEVVDGLIPAWKDRALAAEKERDEWKAKYEDLELHRASCCDRMEKERDAALSRVAEVERDLERSREVARLARIDAENMSTAAKRYQSDRDAAREARADSELSRDTYKQNWELERQTVLELRAKLAEVERERDVLYRVAHRAERLVAAYKEDGNGVGVRACEDALITAVAVAGSALARIDARDATAPTAQDVEAERAEWKALADEFARDAVSLEPAREIVAEYRRAAKKFGPFHNGHEGYAVLLEEVDELWDAVRMQYGPERDAQMRKEVVQVGAMALRFLLDVCDATAQDKTPGGADSKSQVTGDAHPAPLPADGTSGPAPTGGLSPEQRAEVEALCREVVAGAVDTICRRHGDALPLFGGLRDELRKGAK